MLLDMSRAESLDTYAKWTEQASMPPRTRGWDEAVLVWFNSLNLIGNAITRVQRNPMFIERDVHAGSNGEVPSLGRERTATALGTAQTLMFPQKEPKVVVLSSNIPLLEIASNLSYFRMDGLTGRNCEIACLPSDTGSCVRP
jgi:hypothetical protein